MISVLITGGTIAKRYDELSGELVFDEDHLNNMLDQARSDTMLDIKTLMLKDSLNLDDADRESIYDSVINTTNDKILITHGTDTMVQTAQKLSTIKKKTIVLFGAMIPYAFKKSDASFNLGFALCCVDLLDSGVYIAMNGKILNWDSVQKDKKIGRFS